MERQGTERVIGLSDLWMIFIRHIIPIALVAVLCVAGVMFYAKMIVQPRYNSTAMLYVLKKDNDGEYSGSQPDFSLALNVVNDCKYMLKSPTVLNAVINELGLDMSYGGLYGCISTANPSGTRMLEISVQTGDAELSKKIVDCICRVSAEKITAAMGVDQVNIYATGTLENSPCNTVSRSLYLKAGIAGAVLVYAVYFIAFLLDDKIKTEEDVVKYLGLSVLGEIPNANGSKRKKYKYYSYYSSSKKGGTAK